MKKNLARTLISSSIFVSFFVAALVLGYKGFLEYNGQKFNESSKESQKNLVVTAQEPISASPQHMPISFDSPLSSNETMALELATGYIKDEKVEEYLKLRSLWENHKEEHTQWFFLDIQSLIAQNKRSKAIKMLAEQTFTDKAETQRLIFLAALHTVEDPRIAFNYLSQASERDPHNPDIISFKAQILETLDKNEAAASEYIKAVQQNPTNPYLREQIADFYLRCHQYLNSLQVLEDGMEPPSTDTIWLKSIFWNRMIRPDFYHYNEKDLPIGEFSELASYINNLPSGLYWNEQQFSKLTNNHDFLTTRQETYWLRLLAFLKKHQEENALNLLQNNTFVAESWAPELENSLKTILIFRKVHQQEKGITFPTIHLSDNGINTPQQFIKTLSFFSDFAGADIEILPRNLRDIILSQEALALPFLAYGWNGPALELHEVSTFPKEFPDWIALAFTKILQENFNPYYALQYALNQPASPALNLLIADLASITYHPDVTFKALLPIYTREDEIGLLAALKLGQLFLEGDLPQSAKHALLSQPSLIKELTVKEMLAKIAVENGDLETANTFYSELEDYSDEAKSFLAQKAFSERNWNESKRLLQELISKYPENTVLQENLQKISFEERKKR